MFFEIIQSLDKIAVILMVLIFFLLDYRPPWWKSKETKQPLIVPGPRSIPLLGTRWLFHFGSYHLNKLHEFYDEMYNLYGPIVKEEVLFNIPVYSIFERADIEKVLKAPSKYPIRPPSAAQASYRYSRPDRYASAGLVNEQGEKWHSLRVSLTANITSPKTMSNFQNEAMDLANDWCSYIKAVREPNGLIQNINDLVVPLCIETSCALVLGRRLGFMSPEKVTPESLKLAAALQDHFVSLRDTQFSLPFWKFFQTSSYRKMVKSENYIYETVLNMINDFALNDRENTVYSSIINADIDGREKTAAIIDFIAAGIHTLKNSLIFLFYLVAKHPKIQEKIIDDPYYAKASMMESFRLLPTATPLARILEQDMELACHHLKAGSVVLCHNAIACKSDKNFEHPDKFLPERWLGDNKHKTTSMATFLVTPFGAGKRICPGKRFIELVLPIFLQKVVNNFELTTEHILELENEFLLAPKGPVPMFLINRE
ncbi:hypothetical protein WA026_004083 [Henosepilachna vigintioctopunctata]|uniref:Cytochrome P450 n=1 Tax=Henosepilachna vigintioctopunctata TaxID=420089 RepID=A0AAW1U9C4_9CUCU